jgi:hypothetical protein
MSFDVDLLNKKGELCTIKETITEWGTYKVGGTNFCELNITYNYSKFYYWFINKKDGLSWLQDKKAKDTIKQLKSAIKKLGVNPREDSYRAPTPWNAWKALSILLKFAEENPEWVRRVY